MKKFFNAIANSFKSDPNRVGSDGLNRLQRAILENNYDRVKGLIDAGADYNDKGFLNASPLHLAVLKDRGLIAALLIEHGADVQAEDHRGRTPLHIAVSQGQEYLALKMLEKKANPNARDHFGFAPLHDVSSATPDLIGALVRFGADINRPDSDGNTPLHLYMDHPALAAEVLAYEPDVNRKNDRRVSPYRQMLDSDALLRDRYLRHAMIACGPDMSVRNRNGEDIAMCVTRMSMNSDLPALLKVCNIEARDHSGNNLIHKALQAHNYGGFAEILHHAPQLLEMKNNLGHTPLSDYLGRCFEWRFLASFDSTEAAMQAMVEHGADVNSRDQQGRTMAHFATKNARTSLLDYIVRAGINLDTQDRDGNAPIHLAIHAKDIDMLDRLLDAGADPDQTDDRGWTILDKLAKNGDRNSPVVQRLIVAGGQYCKQLPLNPDEIRPGKNPFGGGFRP